MSAIAIRRTAARLLATLAAVAAVASLSSTRLEAQNPDPSAWVGTWSGPFVSDGPTGTFTMVVAREGDAWKVEHSVESEGAPPAGEIRDFKVEGNTYTFTQTFGDLEVVFRGTLEGREIKGNLEAYQGGGLVGTGSYTLTRQ
jgi:hypothetical protein